VACINPAGTGAAVITNSSAERKIILRLGGPESEIHLPAESITTLSWKTI
jgi:hypothetical protein